MPQPQSQVQVAIDMKPLFDAMSPPFCAVPELSIHTAALLHGVRPVYRLPARVVHAADTRQLRPHVGALVAHYICIPWVRVPLSLIFPVASVSLAGWLRMHLGCPHSHGGWTNEALNSSSVM